MSSNERKHVGRTVREEIVIEATPEQVWNAWAKPDQIARWFVDRAEGDMSRDDTVTWCFDTFQYRIPIEVYEAQPAEKLVFGGEVPGRPPSLQEVIVVQEGGATRLRVANSGFGEGADWDDEFDGVQSGWQMALATLKHWLEGRSDKERAHHIVMRPAELEYADMQPLFTTAEGLSRWLTRTAEHESEPLAHGGRVHWTLRDGQPLHGRVLARTERELLVSWEELDGALGLKAFRMGPSRAVALDFSAWELDPGRMPAVQSLLEEAVDSLTGALAGR